MIQETKVTIKNLTEFKSEELFGATIAQLLSREQLPTVGFDHVKIAKGSELQPHVHAAAETFIYILEGTAIVTLDNHRSRVRAGDTIYIPAGVSHGFSTPDEAIALLSVQSPPIYSNQRMPDIHFDSINRFQEDSMQPVPDQAQQTTEVFAAHLALVGKDVQAWVDLFAENAVVEFPYASTTPGRLEGKAAIYSYMKDVPAQMQDLVFNNVRIYPTSNSNVLFAEVHGEAVIVSTGRRYQQDYVMRLEMKEGKIIHYREYWNPVPASEAWGGTENLRQSFNAGSVA
ncbi:cupin domain-containing protein [Phormidium tenue FACHB-886]|nr:cupin domain-containing protein [Phormidium tenue FACHB-886]